MVTIIPPSNNLMFTIGQKVIFYALAIPIPDSVWSLDSTSITKETSTAIIEEEDTKTINSIVYNYCIIKFKSPGDFLVKFTNNDSDSDIFSKTIYGLDTHWVAKQTKVWSNDVGRLCQGLSNSFQRINKWSLFKPIRNTALTMGDPWLNKPVFQSNGAGMQINLWNGWSATISFMDFLTQITGIDDSWNYLYPRGEEYDEYFRLTDFIGYVKEKNNNTINDIEDSPSYYIDSDTLTKENWDTININNSLTEGILNYSNIWLGEDNIDNLGEYYLIVYVIDSIQNKQFMRVLRKLSDQENQDSLIIETPLEDLYLDENLLYDGSFYGIRDSLTRYYFIGNNATVTDQWIELTQFNGEFPTYYSPVSILKRDNQLLPIFKNALAFPVSTRNKNYKIENTLILETTININFTNSYTKKRNLSLRVEQKNNTSVFTFNKNLTISEEVILKVEGVTSQDEGKLIFENCFKTDAIRWEINNTGVYTWFETTEENPNKIEIPFNSILQEIEEAEWKNTSNTLILYPFVF